METLKKSKSREKRKAEEKLQKEKWKMIKTEKNILKMRKQDEKVKKKNEATDVESNGTINTGRGREYTVSVAIPGSILDNAQSPDLRSYLAGQIARACVVFQVDEIIVYDDSAASSNDSTEGEFTGVGKKGHCNVQLARILQYLECPQYLRKSFFPKHPDLKYAGILNPLDCPHHMRSDEVVPFREGVVVDRPVKPGKGSFVDCGIMKDVQIDKNLLPDTRVTVRMSNKEKKKRLLGTVVCPETPRMEEGIYWGYKVRLAGSLSKAIVECPFDDACKYDLTIGTSERGENVDNVKLPDFKHALIVFGGVEGLEAGLDADEALVGIDDPSTLFDCYLNTCPVQGSRTIRTEEAILITLSSLRPKINRVVTKR